MDLRIEAVAEILVDYSLKVKEGEKALITGSPVAEPLILALYRRLLDRGAHPKLQVSLPRSEPILFRRANDEQLGYIWGSDWWIYENVDVSITILSEVNTRQLSNIDPARQVLRSRARKPLFDRYMQRSAEGLWRWNVTLFPTEAFAMEAQMSLDEYEDFYYDACLVNRDDPMGEWKRVAEHHATMIEWMKGRSEVHLEGEGTDLYLDVTDRTFIPANGDYNFPDGEIFTAPIETKTRGHVAFTYPAIYGGRSVEGIKLVFEDGQIVEASAQTNEKFLLQTLDTDPGSRILGELGIGTNYGVTKFTGEILLDEKIGGTVHLAVGASYPECGGTNESAVHWDMVCDLRRGGRISADGDVLMEDGKLLV